MTKKTLLFALISLIIFIGMACQEKEVEEKNTKLTELTTEQQKLGYALGIDIGKNFNKFGVDMDLAAFFLGFEDGLKKAQQPLLSDEEVAKIKKDTSVAMRKKMTEKKKAESEKNKKDGEDFLTANKTKEGVITTESGLQYKIVTKGEGTKPSKTDRVKVNYAGKLIDGTEFDSSFKRGKPVTFAVNGVIAGWTEALQLMETGSKWQLFIPSNLAYKERGAGSKIGPNSTLIFDIELLEIEKPGEKKAKNTAKKEDTTKKS